MVAGTRFIVTLNVHWLSCFYSVDNKLTVKNHCLSKRLVQQCRLLFSFRRTKSRVFIGLLTGHDTVRGHLHWMRLPSSPLVRRRGAEDETSAHTLCECEVLPSLRHAYLGSFCLDLEDIQSLSLGGHLELQRRNRALLSWYQIMGHKGPVSYGIGTVRAWTQMLFNQSIDRSGYKCEGLGYFDEHILCVFVVILCVFAVLCVCWCFYFRCWSAG